MEKLQKSTVEAASESIYLISMAEDGSSYITATEDGRYWRHEANGQIEAVAMSDNAGTESLVTASYLPCFIELDSQADLEAIRSAFMQEYALLAIGQER